MVELVHRTLDTVERITPLTLRSCSVDDCAIQTMTPMTQANSGGGVWISLRGSSTLELWDVDTLCCTMLFDLVADANATIRRRLTVSPTVAEWYNTP